MAFTVERAAGCLVGALKPMCCRLEPVVGRRRSWAEPQTRQPFDALEFEGKVGVPFKKKHAIDLSVECNFTHKVIDRISIYRLPVNFIRDPHAYDLLNECILCFSLRDVGDILFVCEISENGEPSDIRVSSWDSLDKGMASHLTCVWSSFGQHSGVPASN
jgi:hypothetical protein